MSSGQNLEKKRSEWRIKTSLGLLIAGSEIAIIFLAQNLNFEAQILTILALMFLNLAFILFGFWQNNTQNQLREIRKNELHERERILTIINSLPDGILSVSSAGEIEIFNSSAKNLLAAQKSLIGENVHKILQLRKLEGEKFNLRDVFRSGAPFFSTNNLTLESDGEKLQIELEIMAIQGRKIGKKPAKKSFVVILRDITKQKTLDEERDEFISVVSHELRTPVAITEGAISNLQMMISKNAPKDLLEKTVKTSYKQVVFLATIVNDLSTLSRAERGAGDKFEDIDPKKLGEELFIKYQKSAEEKGLTLNLQMSPNLPKIHTSKLYIEELLQNIITNSIKYTKEGSITIAISKEADGVKFAIRDTGIGISRSDQAKIFEKFYRSEDWRTRETGGTGLGLYIASKLAGKLNTKIELESRLNRGSTFGFLIKKV